ncbi:MAG: PEGA domain-containing protein [Thermotogota bacterium]|nr:PEGA domain-containing protein [Thermotogota bacterium]
MRKLLTGTVLFVLLASLMVFGGEYELQKVIIVPEPDQELQVQIWMDKEPGSVYRTGEEVGIFFKTNKDAYIAIYDIMPDGEVQLLFPNKYDKENHVKANREYQLPTDSASTRYKLRVSGPSGLEIFQIVASTSPIAFLDDLVKRLDVDPFPMFGSSAENVIEKLVKPFVEKAEYAVNQTYFYVNTKPTEGALKIRTQPSGADVFVDGVHYGKSPLSVRLSEGSHYITTVKKGYRQANTMANVIAGRTNSITLNLEGITRQYSLIVNSSPAGADVYIDNNYVGQSPIRLGVDQGTHSLRLEKQGYRAHEETININSDTSRSIALQEQIQTYRVEINSNVYGANVYIDGTYRGRTPLVMNLERGSHNFKVGASGYSSYSQSFYISSDRVINVNLSKSKSVVNFSSSPSNTRVYINSSYRGTTPLQLSLDEGTYTVRIDKDGFISKSEEISVQSGQSYNYNFTLEEIKPVAKVRINTNPSDARIFVDGYEVGRTNTTIEIEAGHHEILMLKEGFYSVHLIMYFEEKSYSYTYELTPIK